MTGAETSFDPLNEICRARGRWAVAGRKNHSSANGHGVVA